MRRLVLLAALTALSCNNLYVDNGNAYPCDFSQPPATRDMPCITGDVCGINNVCVKYLYEGPRFEGRAVQPDYAFLDAGVVHPLTLTGPVTTVARSVSRRPAVLARTSAGSFFVNERGQLTRGVNLPDTLRQPIAATLSLNAMNFSGAVGIDFPSKQLAYAFRRPDGSSEYNADGPRANVLRVTQLENGTRLQSVSDGTPMGHTGEVVPRPMGMQVTESYSLVDPVLDIGTLARQGLPRAQPAAVALTSTGLWLQGADGGFEQVSTTSGLATEGTLAMNFGSTLLTATNRLVLSTWQVGVSTSEPRVHTLRQAWADCRPCDQGSIDAVTPLPESLGLGVDVLCGRPSGQTLVRVTGSNAVVPSDSCEVQTLPFSFDLSRARRRDEGPVIASSQRGFAVGGLNGEVWAGETLSTVLPTRLDRVPLDVSTVEVTVPGKGVHQSLLAVADRFFSVLPAQTPDALQPGGFRRVDSQLDLRSAEDIQLMSAVHGVNGWALTSRGVLAQLSLDEAQDSDGGVRFGRRLVTPSGEAVQRSAGGEAFVANDGGLMAMFIAADDGLYAQFQPEASLDELSSGTGDLAPVLQPEPSVPIRSLALERTPLGTDGLMRARGYLVTSRNLYEWKLAGTPARWSSRLLELAGGEPLEVWFDHSKSALGRVGYSDGQIYTLPGGYQLSLPIEAEGDVPVKVLDYENFGGWPVALTTTGLYAAGWETEGGVVQNKFPDGRPNRPMEWKRLTMPDQSAPWERGADTKGRLYVLSTFDAAAKLRHFRLFIFLPEQVIELGHYARK